MSFFDDEGDEPPTRATRPRRPSRARAGARGRSAGAPSDAQQLMVRRAVALGVGALILVLLVVGINGCLNSRAKNALRAYNRDVAEIAQDSNGVSRSLFASLAAANGAPQRLTQNANQAAQSAQDDFDRAKALSVPGDMKAAQQALLTSLSLRVEAADKIAADTPNLTGNGKRAAVRRITADMRLLLASDVLFTQRVNPYILQTLDDHGISGPAGEPSQFLPDDTWLDAEKVGERLGVAGASQTGNGGGNTACPSICGHGLIDVKVGGQTLVAGGTANHVTATTATPFTVDFQNQGDTNEYDVRVTLTAIGQNGKKSTTSKLVDQTTAGQPTSTPLRLLQIPQSNPVRLTVTVAKVPGEKTTSNNTLTYIVFFE